MIGEWTMTKRTNLNRLVECAILLAAAAVLSFIKVVEMPLGGSVTAVSMLPIVLAGYRNGWKWGLLTGVTTRCSRSLWILASSCPGALRRRLYRLFGVRLSARVWTAGHRRHIQQEKIRYILRLRIYNYPALSYAFSVRNFIFRLVCRRGILLRLHGRSRTTAPICFRS